MKIKRYHCSVKICESGKVLNIYIFIIPHILHVGLGFESIMIDSIKILLRRDVMRKKVFLSIAFLLVFVLICGTMAGCKKTESDAGQTTTTAKDAGKETTKAKETDKSTTTTEGPTTIVDNTKLKELTVWTEMDPATAQSCKDLNDHEVFKELERRTGVHVNWIHPTTGEQFNLMIASGEYPDLIRHGWPNITGGAAKYCEDGIII